MQTFSLGQQNSSQLRVSSRAFLHRHSRARHLSKKVPARLILCAFVFGFGIFAPGVSGSNRALADEAFASAPNPSPASNSSATINGDAAIFDGAAATDADPTITNATGDDTAQALPDAASNEAANGASISNADDQIGIVDGAPGDGTLDGVTAAEPMPMHDAAIRKQEREAAQKREFARRRDENRRRSTAKQARIEGEMRRMMIRLGCDQPPVQDAIIAFIADETRARRPLRDQSRKLFQALRSENGAVDANVETLLADFRIALEQDKARHQVGEAALDQRINFKSNPRLEAMLLLFGVIGDGPTFFPTRENAPQTQIQSEEKRLPPAALSTTPTSITPTAEAAPEARATYSAPAAGTTAPQ